MSFEFIKKLPTPQEIREKYPLSEELAAIKKARDEEIRKVFTGESDKFLVIIGPCSADNEEAVLDYVGHLAKVNEKVGDKLILIPRIYTNKPRTTGEGYKGMMHQPDPEKKPDLLAGLLAIRKMHIHAIEQTGLTAADEMLYPENYRYLSDLLSYVAIGARSVEDQQHSHSFVYRPWEVKTTGNELAHTILRGAVNKHGNCIPNYHYEDLNLVDHLYKERNLKNPAVVVDANHSNSNKQYAEQVRIVNEVLHSRNLNPHIKTLVKGVMIESYIEGGNQKIGCVPHIYGKSITDPCLGWDDSEKLIYSIYDLC